MTNCQINKQIKYQFLAYGCILCYETANECHHIEKKAHEISKIAHYCTPNFLKELNKCVPVCTMCHRKIHKENIQVFTDVFMGWWSSIKQKAITNANNPPMDIKHKVIRSSLKETLDD